MANATPPNPQFPNGQIADWQWQQLVQLSDSGQLYGIPPQVLAAELASQNGESSPIGQDTQANSRGYGLFGLGYPQTYKTASGSSVTTSAQQLAQSNNPQVFAQIAQQAAGALSYWVQQKGSYSGGISTFDGPGTQTQPFLQGIGFNLQQPYSAQDSTALASYTPGTQTDVPGTPGAATPAATPAPADVTAGTASSIPYPEGENPASIPTLATGAKWPEVKAYIQKYYPTYSWLLNIKGPDSPETVIKEAVTEGLDSTRIQALVDQTPWWKDTSTALKQWEQNKATNPGDLDFNTKGSSAQQKLGDIQAAAKQAGLQLGPGIAENLATEALMYNWDSSQVQENIAQVASTGHGQVFNPGYEQQVATNPREVQIGGQGGTGPTAATAITTVRNAIAGQGYKPSDFTNADIDNLAKESMEFGWDAQQLAAAVIKVGAGGTGAQLSSQYLQGMMQNPEQYSFGKNGQGPGQAAQQALTDVQQALASAGKKVGGKGGVTEQQVKDLAQETMMFGWNAGQLQVNISKLGTGGGQLSPAYLQGMETNPQEYLPGGQAYVQAQTAVQTALAQSGRTDLGKLGTDALISEYMEQGWQQDPGKLTLAIGQTKGAGALSSQYLTGMQANPQQYQPGGIAYKAAEAAVQAAVAGAGKKVAPSAEQALVQQYLQQGWTEGSPQLVEAIGTAAGGAGYTSQYLQGMQANPQQYEPGGTSYTTAENDVLQAIRNAGVGNLPQSDLNRLVEGVIQQGWDQTTLSNEIGALSHKGNPYNPQYLTGIAQTPLEYQFTSGGGQETTADQVLTQVEMVAANQAGGVNLSISQAHDIAKQAMQYGGNNPPDSLIQSLIQKYVSVAPQTPAPTPSTAGANPSGVGVNYGGGSPTVPTGTPTAQPGTGLNVQTNAPATVEQLRTQAANYFANPSDGVLQQWAQQIAGGTQTIQQFEAAMAQQAAEKYPGMAQLIQQGQTPSQIASNLQTLASQTLEISPDQVNFTDNPTYQKMLDGGYNEGANGTKESTGGMMTYTQAGEYLRGLPQFQYTTNAQSDAANAATEILQAFGRVS